MAQLSKQALIVENNTSFPNNNTNYITPSILRSFNTDMIDSLVDENGYMIDSASWNRSISSLNQFTASATGLSTGSLLVTASAVSNVITFTKGDSSQFSVTVADTTNLGPLNAFTASATISLNNLNLWTSSYQPVIINLQASQSIDNTKWNNLGTQSGSFVTESETGSFARIDVSNTFTQQNIFTSISASSFVSASQFVGDGSKITNITASIALPILDEGIPQGNAFSMNFTGSAISAIVVGGIAIVSVNVPDTGSFNALTQSFNTYTASTDAKFVAVQASTSSLNAFTASQQTINTNVSASQSIDTTKWNTLGGQSGSWVNVPLDSLNSFTQSQDTKNSTLATYTASVDQKFSNIGGQSGSWITESETASFARTNVNNNFSVNQTFTNITAVSASFQYVQTTYETSSIIYSSGSNQLGDELTDIQTLSGSVKVQGSLTINGTPVQTSSVDITSLNAFTQSQDTKNSTLATYTQSVNTSLTNINSFTASNGNTSLNSYTASNDTKWNTLGGQTGSYVTSAITASSLVTASVNLNTITFTKGDASTFNITVNTGSGGGGSTDITSLNAFTASQNTKNATLGNLTGSFATTGSNTFVGNQTISSSLFISGNINMVNGADLVTHHVRAAGSNGLELQNASSGIIVSMGAGGGTQASFTGAVTANSISASTITGLGNVTDYSTSVDARLDSLEALTSSIVPLTSLNAFTASQQLLNTTFATTGSNTFYGVQTQVSSSYSGSLINNITPISSSLSKTTNIVTLTASEYAGITPVTTTLYIVI